MKGRPYQGCVIEARSSELKDGGWDCEFSIEEHDTGVTDGLHGAGVFPDGRGGD